MDIQYGPPPSPLRPLKDRLVRTSSFDVDVYPDELTLHRRRIVPRRGLFRMLLPWLVVRMRVRGPTVTTSIRPDPLAWLMLVMLSIAFIGEFRMDRLIYPRDYPPEVIYTLAIGYTALVLIEFFVTRRALRRALADP